jgi:hypothetical protein
LSGAIGCGDGRVAADVSVEGATVFAVLASAVPDLVHAAVTAKGIASSATKSDGRRNPPGNFRFALSIVVVLIAVRL